MKDAYYFSHDSNARNDLKIVKLKRLCGLEGLGLFWCVIEMLREAEKYELPIDDIEDICYELRCEVKIFNTLFDCKLLVNGKDNFYSKSLKIRMLHLDKIRQKRKEAGAKGGKSKAIGKQLVSNSKASKVKQSKVNKSKVSNKETFNLFWDHYYKLSGKEKTDKVPAFKKWELLTSDEQRAAYLNAEPYINYVLKKYGKKYIKKARTYLNDKNFNDDLTINDKKVYVE